jgi:hypothetical protein
LLLQEKHKNILENIFSQFPKEGVTLSPYTLLDIKEAIHDSSLPMLIDIFDWQQLPESFEQNILSRHEVLYRFN